MQLQTKQVQNQLKDVARLTEVLKAEPTEQNAREAMDVITKVIVNAAQERVSHKVSRPPTQKVLDNKKW